MDIREVIKRYVSDLQKTARIISEIDMLQSFSVVSDENKFTRPKLIDEKSLKKLDKEVFNNATPLQGKEESA